MESVYYYWEAMISRSDGLNYKYSTVCVSVCAYVNLWNFIERLNLW